MTQWEYKQAFFHNRDKEHIIVMNELGEKGWELVSYTVSRNEGFSHVATFKRKVCYYEGKASPI